MKSTEILRPSIDTDTIIANASPLGKGAISVLRASGTRVKIIVERYIHHLSQSRLKERRAVVVDIVNDNQEKIESALAILFIKPKSYTGEDVLELQVHANPILISTLLQLFCQIQGVRIATPGEFTRRAYENQKIDLEQAEAINRIIQARSYTELIASQKNFNGHYRNLTSQLRSQLIHLKAQNSAEMDLPDELDVLPQNIQKRNQFLDNLIDKIKRLLDLSQRTRASVLGLQVCIIGHTNVGKSTLFNQLIEQDRAITSKQEGTTRDYISETIYLSGSLIRLIDTAGLRNPHIKQRAVDSIEQQGVETTKKLMQQSNLNIVVASVDQLSQSFLLAIESLNNMKKNQLYVINKIDLIKTSTKYKHALQSAIHKSFLKNAIFISCQQNHGISKLKNMISKKLQIEHIQDEAILLEERQSLALQNILHCLINIKNLCSEDAPLEIVSVEIDNAIEHASQVTKRIESEEVLGRIFSMFCVGK